MTGGWRQRDRKVMCKKWGDLYGTETEFMLPERSRRAGRAGVRASVRAVKSRNGDGAKGRREVES